MILGVGVAELIKTVPLHHIEHALFQRQVVLYGLSFTQIMFIALQLFYSESLEWKEPGGGPLQWDVGFFAQQWRRTSSMLTFIMVEVLVAYNIDSYWILLEEGCNIQQAKKIFKVVNNGQVVSLLLIGWFVGYVPWSFYMSAASLMSLATAVMFPCQILFFIIAPADVVSRA